MTEEFPEDEVSTAAHNVVGDESGVSQPSGTQYDYLFDPQQDPQLTQEDVDKWPQLNEWQQKLFAPVIEKKQDSHTPQNYDFLFDDSVAPPPPYVPGVSHSKPEVVRLPTSESIAQAEEFLTANGHSFDPTIKQIIEHVSSKVIDSPEAMMEVSRTNAEVRQALARYFLSKMSVPEAPSNRTHVRFWPEQIIYNSNKESNLGGYPDNIKSRDYAILITLAVLDGSFKHGRSGSDTVEIREKRHSDYLTEKYISVAHHRGSAALLLGLEPGAIS